MKREDEEKTLGHLRSLTNEKLIAERDDLLYQILQDGSGKMEKREWDPRDIEDRRRYEKYLGECHSLAKRVCKERGIK